MHPRTFTLLAALTLAACQREETHDPWKAPPYVPSAQEKFSKTIDLKTVVDHEPTVLHPKLFVYEPTRGGEWKDFDLEHEVAGKYVDIAYATSQFEDAATLVYLEEVHETAGAYSDGTKGTRMNWRAHFIDIKTKTVVGEKTFEGYDPPATVGPGESTTGNMPSKSTLWDYVDPLVK